VDIIDGLRADLNRLAERLDALESRGAPRAPKAFDPSALEQRADALEAWVNGVDQVSGDTARRVDALEAAANDAAKPVPARGQPSR